MGATKIHIDIPAPKPVNGSRRKEKHEPQTKKEALQKESRM